MNAEIVARIIQQIIAPAVLVHVCMVMLNGVLGRYAGIGDRLRSLAHERLELLHHNDLQDTIIQERLQEITVQIPVISHRHRLLQSAVLITYGATMIFLLSMFAIALSTGLSSNPSHMDYAIFFANGALFLFLSGAIMLLAAVFYITLEIRFSHQAIYYEIKRVTSISDTVTQRNSRYCEWESYHPNGLIDDFAKSTDTIEPN
ncbi:MAG: DUF2721 domain-containing protein [Pseudanabaenaceae cyanobacterium]|jgi:hypothetical protein